MTITKLINTPANFELVRDTLAAILANESASQMALASSADLDPTPWRYKVYVERAHPWQQWLDTSRPDKTPIVNVTYDTSNFPKNRSDEVSLLTHESTYNIDVYGYGSAALTETGQIAGDYASAIEVQRVMGLILRILKAPDYRYLGLTKKVLGRWPINITMYRPEFDGQLVQNVTACRLQLQVDLIDTAPQTDGQIVEYIEVTKMTSQGAVNVITAVDYTEE